MRRASSLETKERDPVGAYFAPSATALAWCRSATLAGAVVWGRPTAMDAERLLAVFDGYRSAMGAGRVSLILDARGVEAIDPDAFALLMAWLRAHRAELMARVRVQFGVVAADSLVGVTLSGILPMIGETHEFRVVVDPLVAFRELSPDGATLCAEIEHLVAEARGLPAGVRGLREFLGARPPRTSLAAAARWVGVARRTLQRQLRDAGTTFRNEVKHARVGAAWR